MRIEVFKKDFKKDVEGFGALGAIVLPPMPCTVAIEVSGKVEDADYNILRDRLIDSLEKNPLADKLAVSLYKLSKSTDELVGALIVGDQADKIPAALAAYKKNAQAEVDKFEAEVAKVFIASWKKFIEDRQKYKTYKIKAGLDFTVNVVSLLGSIASLAASATPAAPVTAVMGIYGILKNTTKLCVQCRNLYIEAETVAKDVDADVASLKKKFDKVQADVEKGTDKALAEAKKAKREEKVKELSVAVGNKLFGDIVGVFVASVQGVTKKNSLYGNKIRGIQEETRKFAKDYLAMADHMQELYKYLRELDDQYTAMVSKLGYGNAKDMLARRQKKIKTAFDAWNGAQKAVKLIQVQVADSETRHGTNLVRQKELQGIIDDLEKSFKTKKWAEAGRWLGVAADVGLSIGPSGAAGWSSTDKVVTSVMKLVTIAEKEVITEIKERLMK